MTVAVSLWTLLDILVIGAVGIARLVSATKLKPFTDLGITHILSVMKDRAVDATDGHGRVGLVGVCGVVVGRWGVAEYWVKSGIRDTWAVGLLSVAVYGVSVVAIKEMCDIKALIVGVN